MAISYLISNYPSSPRAQDAHLQKVNPTLSILHLHGLECLLYQPDAVMNLIGRPIGQLGSV